MRIRSKIHRLQHFLRKLRNTLSVCVSMALARTFGRYRHSVHDYGFTYAIYEWRGRTWYIPTGPVDLAEQLQARAKDLTVKATDRAAQ